MEKSSVDAAIGLMKKFNSRLEFLKNQCLQSTENVKSMNCLQLNLDMIEYRQFLEKLIITNEKLNLLIEGNRQIKSRNQQIVLGLKAEKREILNIIESGDVPVENIDSYLEEPLDYSEWETSFENKKNLIQKNIQAMNKKKRGCQKLLQKNAQLSYQVERAKRQYQKERLCPNKFKKILTQMEYFASQSNLLNSLDENEEVTDKKLLQIQELVSSLGVQSKLLIKSGKRQFQFIEIHFKELDLEIDSFSFKGKDMIILLAKVDKIDEILIGIEKNIIQSKELFHRLYQNEQVIQPLTVISNFEFVQLKWVKSLLILPKNEVIQIIRRLRERILSIQILESIWKKISQKITGFKELSFLQYTSKIKIPQQIKSKLLKLKLSESRGEKDKFLARHSALFITHRLEDYIFCNLNQYFEFKVIFPNFLFTIVAIIPFQYPSKKSEMKLINIEIKKKKRPFKKEESSTKNLEFYQKEFQKQKLSFLKKQKQISPAFLFQLQINNLFEILQALSEI